MARKTERPLSVSMLAAFTNHPGILDAINENMREVRKLKNGKKAR